MSFQVDELASLKMVEAGLAPMPKIDATGNFKEDPVVYVRETLSSLTPDERKKAVRKFRKLHRKALKPTKGKAPSLWEKRKRMTAVFRMFKAEFLRELNHSESETIVVDKIFM